MKQVRSVLLAGLAVSLGACGGIETCEEPEFYEAAVGGKRIEAPEDLSGLSAAKELVVPEASPRAPRPPGSGCLDRPPTLAIDAEEDSES